MTIFNTRVCGIRRGILDDAEAYPQVSPQCVSYRRAISSLSLLFNDNLVLVSLN